ncbi:MAG: plastocyanin/azurin family copper-binding protein [Flavobacteriaceae bacterium]
MKHLAIPFLLIMLFNSCTRNVEGIEETPCNEEPVVHEIVWEVGVNGPDASLTIAPGDTVRWIWGEDDMPHNVVSDDANAPEDFGSEILTGGGMIYEFTFTEETVFEYRCSVHPATMFGTITVILC